jgi:hypothetical protein
VGYTWEAIHIVSLIIFVLPLSSSQPSGIEPGQMGLPENNNTSKAEYTNTQQDLPDKNKIRLDMHGFLAGGFVLPKATKS